MNEILKGYLIKAVEWLETGAAWVTNEIPIYISELLKWELWSSIIYMIMGTIFLMGAFIFYKVMMKYHKKWKEDWDGYFKYDGQAFFFLFGVAGLSLSGFPIIMVNLFKVVKILVAPRVFLLEYLTTLLGS